MNQMYDRALFDTLYAQPHPSRALMAWVLAGCQGARVPSVGSADRTCAAPACANRLQRHNKSGFCSRHNHLARRAATATAPARPERLYCQTPGCGQALRRDNTRGFCRVHARPINSAAFRARRAAQTTHVAVPPPVLATRCPRTPDGKHNVQRGRCVYCQPARPPRKDWFGRDLL